MKCFSDRINDALCRDRVIVCKRQSDSACRIRQDRGTAVELGICLKDLNESIACDDVLLDVFALSFEGEDGALGAHVESYRAVCVYEQTVFSV